MNLKNTNFVLSAADAGGFPKDGLKRLVFVGRSNVGKSSTINALIGRKGYARVSSEPGKTVFVNLYNADGRAWIVDLPGYGYSKTSKQERRRYSELIEQYLASDMRHIARIYMIVDIRHAPSADDRMMADWIRAHGLPATVIANKLDKLKPSQVEGCLDTIRADLALPDARLIPFSAQKGTNRPLIVEDILRSLEESGQ